MSQDGSNRKTFKDGGKKSNLSKIPRPKTPSNRINDDEHLAFGEDLERNEIDPSFLQLYITKVYLIQDSLRKNQVTMNGSSKLDNNVLILADRITELCHKIKDVESHMYVGSKNVSPKIEFGPGGDIHVSDKHDNNYLGVINSNYFDDATSNKSAKNALNATTSQLFSPMEFSFDNMFGQSIETKNTFSTQIMQEFKTRTVDVTDKNHLIKTLDTLSYKTEDIMQKISMMDVNIKQLNIFKEASQTNEICEYCKMFFDEMTTQKQQIKDVVDALKECVDQFPSYNNCQEQIEKLSASLQTVLTNTEDICQNINISKNPPNYFTEQPSFVKNKKSPRLWKKYPELTNGHFCFESDYLDSFSTNEPEEKAEVVIVDERDRYKSFKRFLRKNRKRRRKERRKDLEPKGETIADGCSNFSVSSKKSKNFYKNDKTSKNNSSCKECKSSGSFRKFNVSESLKLNEDTRENSQDIDAVGSGDKIVWNNKKSSERVVQGIIRRQVESDQIIEKTDDSSVISSERYAKIVMELNDIMNQQTNKEFPVEDLVEAKRSVSGPLVQKFEESEKKPRRRGPKLRIFSSKKALNQSFSTKCVQHPSKISVNDSKCCQVDNLPEPTRKLLEKSCLCKLCGCKPNTVNLTSKISVANYLCELLNTTLKCDEPPNPETLHVNLPSPPNLPKKQKEQDNLENKTLQELFLKNALSKSSDLITSFETDSLDLLQSKSSLKKKKSSWSKINFNFFKSSRCSGGNNSNVSRKIGKFSMLSSTGASEDDVSTPRTIPLREKTTEKEKEEKKGANVWMSTENYWNSDSSSADERSYFEFVDLKSPDVKPIKSFQALKEPAFNVLYSLDNDPRRKPFAYESVSLFEKPSKEPEIIKEKIELSDLKKKNPKISKSIYTSSSVNDNSSSDKKYYLCVTNDINDIKKLETMGLTPIVVNKSFVDIQKWSKVDSGSVVGERCTKSDSINNAIDTSRQNLNLSQQILRILEDKKKLEEVLRMKRLLIKQKVDECKSNDSTKPIQNKNIPVSSKEEKKLSTKKSFLKRLLGKKLK